MRHFLQKKEIQENEAETRDLRQSIEEIYPALQANENQVTLLEGVKVPPCALLSLCFSHSHILTFSNQ